MVYNKLFDVSLAIKNTELYKYPSKGVIGEDEIISCQDIFHDPKFINANNYWNNEFISFDRTTLDETYVLLMPHAGPALYHTHRLPLSIY